MNTKLVNMMFFIIIMATAFSHINCMSNGSNKKDQAPEHAYTMTRPVYVPGDATLLRFGSAQEPRLVWAEYAGPYRNEGKVYNHIFGVRYFYNTNEVDTLFYENFDIRNGKKTFDPLVYKMLYAQVDESALTIAKNGDTLDVFEAVHGGPGPMSNGVQMVNVPSVKKAIDNLTYVAGSWITSYLKKEGQSGYSLLLEGGEKIPYRLCDGCHGDPSVIRFINVEDGRVYFIEKDCWMEVIDRKDVTTLKNFH
jgi:hypothetical protein